MMSGKMNFYQKTAVVWSDGKMPHETQELVETKFFATIVKKSLAHLSHIDSPLLELFPHKMGKIEREETIIQLLIRLNARTREELAEVYPEMQPFFEKPTLFHEFVEEFYNYWRNHERYLICLSEGDSDYDKNPYKTFRYTVSHVNDLFRKAYRDICEHITGNYPRIYRQVAAAFQVGLIATKKDWCCPPQYANVKTIPFVRQTLLYPPLIIDPMMNKRTGQFKKVDENPLEGLVFEEKEWLCYPARVGKLLIHVYVHNKFVGLGCSLSNLFELATDEELAQKPDAIYAFGVEEDSLKRYGELPTVFYDDEKNDLFVAAIPRKDEFDYFGYLKKMILTLHNSIMMKRGLLPIHGAMVNITLKDGEKANVIILGDSGAGKSESLEAFRILGEEYIREMKIIFDDMGCLEIQQGQILAYGTEIGAFVRLDDLQPGFAFGNLDRSIIMSPQKVNARAVLPVTTLKTIMEGQSVDFLLYANNYEEVDEEHPLLERFTTQDEAIKTFREGAVMSKGTTTTKGLVHTYFANIFGPPQYKELHEKIAERFFTKLFEDDVYVGELRTRLGIKGCETQGPQDAAKALFDVIRQR